MAGLLDYIRGVGEFELVDRRGFELLSGRVRRIPESFLTFSLNRDIPNWPWPQPSPWQRISLPANTGAPGRKNRRDGAFAIDTAWAFDWIHPGPYFIGPACGSPATGEYAVTFSEGVEIGLEFPDLDGFRVAGGYIESEARTSNITMDSSNVERPDPRFIYQVKPLVEALHMKRIVNYYGGSGRLTQFFSYGPFDSSESYQRTLFVEGLSYAVARMACPLPENLDESGDGEEEGNEEQ